MFACICRIWMNECVYHVRHIGIVWSISSRFNTFRAVCQSPQYTWYRYVIGLFVRFVFLVLFVLNFIQNALTHARISSGLSSYVFSLLSFDTLAHHIICFGRISCTGRLLLTTMLRCLFTLRASILSIYSRIQVISIWPYHCLTTRSHNRLCRSLCLCVCLLTSESKLKPKQNKTIRN